MTFHAYVLIRLTTEDKHTDVTKFPPFWIYRTEGASLLLMDGIA